MGLTSYQKHLAGEVHWVKIYTGEGRDVLPASGHQEQGLRINDGTPAKLRETRNSGGSKKEQLHTTSGA